jgi:hypothetical protein
MQNPFDFHMQRSDSLILNFLKALLTATTLSKMLKFSKKLVSTVDRRTLARRLEEFHLLPELPIELRLMVWQRALPGPRTITVKYRRQYVPPQTLDTISSRLCRTPFYWAYLRFRKGVITRILYDKEHQTDWKQPLFILDSTHLTFCNNYLSLPPPPMAPIRVLSALIGHLIMPCRWRCAPTSVFLMAFVIILVVILIPRI